MSRNDPAPGVSPSVLARRLAAQRGQGTVELALLLILVAVVAIVALHTMGDRVQSAMTCVSSGLRGEITTCISDSGQASGVGGAQTGSGGGQGQGGGASGGNGGGSGSGGNGGGNGNGNGNGNGGVGNGNGIGNIKH